MQSTVFDFTFRLKRTDDQFYILPSSYNIIVFNFSNFLVVQPAVDFSLSTSIRINNDVSIEYLNIDEYCAGKRCKDRFYINGTYAYMSLFSLQAEDGFVAKPEYLMRDSKSVDIISGRMFIGGVFVHNQQRYGIRGYKFSYLMLVNSAPQLSLLSDITDVSLLSSVTKSSSFTDNLLPLVPSLNNAKLLSGSNYFLKIIENTISYEPSLFHEKGDFPVSISIEINMNITKTDFDLEGFTAKSGIDLHLYDYLHQDLNDFTCKYAIISINRYLTSTNSHYSNRSRFTANKGVI